ncbi:hypothetical protein [Candidatus Poriferisocius sp.]|uniref:hypothetical protein n=1 Tax=Candidatus Poriferisocius sp. TaxID=3101276 RepID=UPI003B59C775
MVQIEELLEQDLAAASNTAADVMPDIVAALDRLMPQLFVGGDRASVRRYWVFVHEAAQVLTALPARNPDALPPSVVVFELLRRDTAELPWVAPSQDGIGLVTVLVDRLRGFTAGLPQECVRARPDIDEHRFRWFLQSMDQVEYEQERSSPLRRAMTTLELTSSDVAEFMGVKRQAVDKWLFAGPPVDRSGKIGAISEISDILRHRLRAGMPAVVARRRADAYGGRTMLELIAADEHEWLLQSVRESFDYGRVA